MVDFKHMHKSNQIKPTSESWQDGWGSNKVFDIAIALLSAAAMIAAMFYGLSEAVIRGWIG